MLRVDKPKAYAMVYQPLGWPGNGPSSRAWKGVAP